MEQLMQPERLRERMLVWTEEKIRAGALPATLASRWMPRLFPDKV